MPNPVITLRTLAVVLLASLGSEVSEVASFMRVLPEQLLMEAKQRAIAFAQQKGANLGLQYATMAVSQAVGGSNVDLLGPAKLFIKVLEALNNASSVEEAASKGTVALGALILSGASAGDSNASLVFGGFLVVFLQNIVLLGSQVCFSKALLPIYVINSIFIRVVTEIRVERKRRKLKLRRPKLKLKLNFFRKEKNQDFIFKYIRFKKKKFKILARNVWLPVLYQKKLIIKQPVFVKPITI